MEYETYYDIVPSADETTAYGKRMGGDISEREWDVVRKTCRRYGVNFVMVADYAETYDRSDEFEIVFFTEYVDYITNPPEPVPDENCTVPEEKDRVDELADCIHEIDCRTSLRFETKTEDWGSGKVIRYYNRIKWVSYEDLLGIVGEESGRERAVVRSEYGNCPFGSDCDNYVMARCKNVKASLDDKRYLASRFDKIYADVVRMTQSGSSGIICRMAKPDLRLLSRFAPLGGIAFCRMMYFICGPGSGTGDFYIYVFQYFTGAVITLLVDKSGRGHCKDGIYAVMMLNLRLEGELVMYSPNEVKKSVEERIGMYLVDRQINE